MASTGCASGQSECQANAWSGNCALVSVAKVRESEFPLPNVVLEGIYRPQPVAGTPVLLPGDARREFGALDKYEGALDAHLRSYPLVRCYVNPPPPGQCQPGQMVVEVPEFDPSRAQADTPDSGPRGCAQIEAASAQDRVTAHQTSSTVISERFQFAENSAELEPEANAQLDSLAQRLRQAPNLQCVGVVGAWVRGESTAVAFAPARAVRDQLARRGVESERMVTLTVDPPPVGVSGTPEPPKPADRKVSISVLLDVPQATAPR